VYSIHMYIPRHIRYSILVCVLSRPDKNYILHDSNSNLPVRLDNRDCSRRCIFPVVRVTVYRDDSRVGIYYSSSNHGSFCCPRCAISMKTKGK
jgi:hypothetical protein